MITETTSSVFGVVGRVTGDVVSVSIAFGTLVQILPPLASLISILWVGYQFYNSEPFQKWLKARKDKKNGIAT